MQQTVWHVKMFIVLCCAHHHRRFWHATLRLRSAIRRHHPPQRAVLSQTCCFGKRKVVLFQIQLDSAEPRDAGTTWLSSPVRWRGTNRMLLASALSSMLIICPNKVSRRDWIIAVSLGCFVSLRTSSFRTNWYHLMPSSMRRHHLSSASILRASVFDIAQQSKPYRNTGKMHVLYSFNFVQVASRDLQIWFSRLCMAARVMALLCTKTKKVPLLLTRGQSNLTKSASRGAHSPVMGHPRGSKFVSLNSWGRGSY